MGTKKPPQIGAAFVGANHQATTCQRSRPPDGAIVIWAPSSRVMLYGEQQSDGRQARMWRRMVESAGNSPRWRMILE